MCAYDADVIDGDDVVILHYEEALDGTFWFYVIYTYVCDVYFYNMNRLQIWTCYSSSICVGFAWYEAAAQLLLKLSTWKYSSP